MAEYHIVLNRPTDLEGITEGAAKGMNPRHSMAELAKVLNAKIHDGTDSDVSAVDKALASLTRTKPIWWAIARRLKSTVKTGDVVFCTGEDVGFPVAALCGSGKAVKVSLMVHHIDSVKKRIAFELLGLRGKVSKYFAVTSTQIQYMRESLEVPPQNTQFICDQTDTEFFSPGRMSPSKSRHLIMSVGLERRDYTTLASATSDLKVDVRISGFSADTRVLSQAFPAEMPKNMTRQFYSWPDLQQLYRDADVVVVSLYPNRYAAGVQALMEGLASGRPVVVTATAGLVDYLDRTSAIRVVKPGDIGGMRAAIQDLLRDSEEHTRISREALQLARERHRCEDYVASIATALRSVGGESAG